MKLFRLTMAVGLLMVAFSPCAFAVESSYGNATVAKVVGVYDGDTITVDIAGWPAIIGENISVRIAGIDAPEMKGGTMATRGLAEKARNVVARILKGAKVVELRNLGRDKYFRIGADVWADNINIGEYLYQNGLAKRYDGGTKEAW